MSFVRRRVAAFSSVGSWLCFAAIVLLLNAASGHAQLYPNTAARPPETQREPATEVQLDLVVMQTQHDSVRHFLRDLLNSSEKTISNEKSPLKVPLGVVKSSRELLAFLEVLREEGLVKLLAEPRLITISGRAATLSLGDEQTGPSCPADNDLVVVPSEASGKWINFVPTVLPNGKIRLEVERKFSRLVPAPSGKTMSTAPGRDIYCTNTTVELKAGETFVIGGLMRRTRTETVNSIPLLGRLPFVGSVFRTKEVGQAEVELIVLVTPYLFHPAADSQNARGAARQTIQSNAIRSQRDGDASRWEDGNHLRQLERRLKRLQKEVEGFRKKFPHETSSGGS